MELDTSIRKADGRILAVMVAVLVGLVALVGYNAKDPTVFTARVAPGPAHLSMLSTASQVAVGVVGMTSTEVREETWGADESSQGSRSDAAH